MQQQGELSTRYCCLLLSTILLLKFSAWQVCIQICDGGIPAFLKVWFFLRKCLFWNVLKAGCWSSEKKMGSHAFQPNGPPIHLGVQMWTRQPILCHERIHWIPIFANTSSLFPLRNSVDEISRPIDSIVVQRIVLQNGRNTLKTLRCVFVLSLTPRQMFLKSS